MRLTVRHARPEDLRELACIHHRSSLALYRSLFSARRADELTTFAKRLKQWRSILASDGEASGVLVAQLEETSVGVSRFILGPEKHTADVQKFYVDPEAWRRGIGRALLQAVEADMAARGARVARLEVVEDNHRARSFYEACGWSIDGCLLRSAASGFAVRDVVYHRDLTLRAPP